jgi:hypothetical protein
VASLIPMPIRRHPRLYGVGLPIVILVVIVACVGIQVEVSHTVTDFNQRLCRGSNNARMELNQQKDAITRFLHASIRISKQTQQQTQQHQTPELRRARVAYRAALNDLFRGLHDVTLTDCDGP